MNSYGTSKHTGTVGLKIHWMRSNDGKLFWCRRAIAIFGSFNMPYEELFNMSPFDPNFRDNFVEGKGATKEEALKKMEEEHKNICDSLWI